MYSIKLSSFAEVNYIEFFDKNKQKQTNKNNNENIICIVGQNNLVSCQSSFYLEFCQPIASHINNKESTTKPLWNLLAQKTDKTCVSGGSRSPVLLLNKAALLEIDNGKCVLARSLSSSSHRIAFHALFRQSIVGAHTRLRSFTTTVMNLSSLEPSQYSARSRSSILLIPINYGSGIRMHLRMGRVDNLPN